MLNSLHIHPSHHNDMRRVGVKLAFMAAVLTVLWLIPMPAELRGIAGYEPLHTFFETIAIVVAGLIFAVIWNAHHGKMPWNMMFLACAFAGVGLLDLSHFLSIKGMPLYVTPSNPEKAINFWFAARMLAAIALLIATTSQSKIIKAESTRYWFLSGVLVFVGLVHWLILFHPEQMPRTFIKGQGLTDFKVAVEYLLILLNLIAALILLRRMRSPLTFNAASLFAAMAAMAMGEFLFTMYGDVTDIFLVAGHIFKIIAYLFLYQSVFVGFIEKPYQEINELHSRLKATFAAVPDLIFEVDSEGRFQQYHSAQSELLATSPENFLGRTVFEVLPAEAASTIMHSLHEAKEQGRSSGHEISLELPIGQRWFELSVARNANIAGELSRFIVLSRDITERKQEALTFRENADFIKTIADNTPGMLAYWTKDLVCNFSNQSYLTWFGRTPEQMHAIKIQDLLGEELFKQNEAYIQAVLRGEDQRFERTLVNPNGEVTYTWIQYIAHKVDDKVAGFFVLVSDITPLRTEQEAVRENEQRFRTLIATIPQQVWTANPDGALDFVSQRVTDYFGRTFEEMIGWGWEQVVHPDDLHECSKRWLHSIASGEPYEVEFRLKNAADKSYHWHLAMALPLKDLNGKIVKWYGTNTDISERKQAEHDAFVLRDQLSQTAKMEAVGHLSAGIAHDFNNILGAIMGYAELSKHVIAAGTSKAVTRYLDEVVKASQRAKELVAQMLTFSRLSPDNKDVPVTLLAPIVKEVVSLLRSSIPSSIELNSRVDSTELKANILPINLHQIILNLGINARDAIGEYGKIDVILGSETVQLNMCSSCKHQYAGEYAKLTIHDSGSGIPGPILANIFDPFFTTKEVGKGTGMGLAVVHGLVHTLGGHIQVESELGKGSKISILLPLVQNEALVDPTITLPTEVASIVGMRIMLVDDETAMTALLHEFFSMHEAQITLFNSSLAAWRFFEQQHEQVDVVITDETMPDLSGMHLAERMLKLKSDLPIILCTGYSDHATPELAVQAGIAGFLYKPLKLDELLNLVRKVVK